MPFPFQKDPPLRRSGPHVTMLVICTVVLVATFLLKAHGNQKLAIGRFPLPEFCLVRHFATIPCAACGMTRSFVALSRGDVHLAFTYHPLGPILFGLVLAQLPWHVVQLYRVRHDRLPLRWPGATITIAVLLLAALLQWIARIIWVAVVRS